MGNRFLLLFWLFLVHAFEEYFTRFFDTDPLVSLLASQLSVSRQAIFLAVQLLWLGFLLSLFLVSRRVEVPRWLSVIVGLAFILELSHVGPAIASLSYYPGLYTSIFIVLAGIYYWKALLVSK